jgi:hypothetical protein
MNSAPSTFRAVQPRPIPVAQTHRRIARPDLEIDFRSNFGSLATHLTHLRWRDDSSDGFGPFALRLMLTVGLDLEPADEQRR